jgi:hypothetical protein
MTKVKYFEKKVKLPRLEVRGSKSWYQMKGLVRRNTHVQYESLRTYQLRVMTKVKVFKKVKLPRSGGQDHGIKNGSCQKEYTCGI